MASAVSRAFEAQGMSLKDETCVKVASKVGAGLGIGDFTELAEEYEVFHINRGESTNVVTAELLEAFRDHLMRQRSQASTKKKNGWHSYSTYDLNDVSVSLDRSFSKVETRKKNGGAAQRVEFAKPGAVAASPSSGSKRTSEVPEVQPNKKSAFSQRQRSGTDFATLAVKPAGGSTRQAEAALDRAAGYSKVIDEESGVRSLLRGPGTGSRFMYDTVEQKQRLADERIRRLVDLLESKFGVDASSPVYGIANEPVVCCGRVLCDSSEGRLNEQSVLLEGPSSDGGQGMRVRLDTTKLGSVNLFPGQVVAVEGINPSGHCITAFGILTGVPQPRESQPAASGARGKRVAVAAGPFSTSEDLSMEPLGALVEACVRERPDLVYLCGPFVDKDHPLVKEGKVDLEHEEIFELCCDKLKGLPEGTKAVLVPSVRDVHHDACFPQSAFRVRGMPGDVREKLVCAPNPAVISGAGLTVAATSHDVLRHLSGSELFRAAQQTDRMSRLASHVLLQRTFYPLHPPVRGACLDHGLALDKDAIFLPSTPDVLVLPSDLNPFAREVETSPGVHVREGHRSVFLTEILEKSGAGGRCVCVNPGRLAKGTAGGTYCVLELGEGGGLEKATIRRI